MVAKYPERFKHLNTKSDNDMLGGGWGFPVNVNNSGGVELQEGNKHIGSCVKHFAMYSRTDLVGTPTFGGGVPDLLWKIITNNLLGIKEEQMRNGLEVWDKRLTNIQVVIGKSSESPNKLVEKVFYTNKVTGDTEYLRFPISGGSE